jgi:ubiquitin-protein ligase
MCDSPENTLYEGGLFKAHLTFPHDYPHQPPKMTFKTEMWHPNVYTSGLVCISILHPPEDDKFGYEDAGERWLPVHTPQTILLSVISMVPLFSIMSNSSYHLPMTSPLQIPMPQDNGARILKLTKRKFFD